MVILAPSTKMDDCSHPQQTNMPSPPQKKEGEEGISVPNLGIFHDKKPSP